MIACIVLYMIAKPKVTEELGIWTALILVSYQKSKSKFILTIPEGS